MKTRRKIKRRRTKRRGGGQYLSNVGWSTGYQTLPTSYLHGYDSAFAASPGIVARSTTNWV